MTELATPLSRETVADLVERAHALRSQVIARLIRNAVSAIRRRLPPRASASACSSASLAEVKVRIRR